MVSKNLINKKTKIIKNNIKVKKIIIFFFLKNKKNNPKPSEFSLQSDITTLKCSHKDSLYIL